MDKKSTSFKVTYDLYSNSGKAIFKKYTQFTSIKELALEYGVAFNTMHNIVVMLKLSKGLEVKDGRVKDIATRNLDKIKNFKS